MRAGFFIHILLAVFLLPASCSGPESAREPAGPEGRSSIERVKGIHPRILLTQEKQEKLKSTLETTHKWLWDRYLQDIPGKLAGAGKPFPDEINRGHGDIAPDLCFAWLMTGEDSLFLAAKGHLLELAHTPEWDPGNDLIHGHLLTGMALAYDWLYNDLSDEERSLTAARLARAAEAEYRRMTTGRVWYRHQYFQNHGQTNFCGLAYAAAALYGEDPRAERWLSVCRDYFDKMFRVLPADGTSGEDISYGLYGLDFNLKYADLARDLLDRDYFGSEWFRNSPDYILHSMVPSPTEEEQAITFGDAPRHLNWHGPEHSLFLLASEYGNTTAQWLARYFINLRPEGLSSATFWAILWYDPSIGEADPAEFATFKHFTDMGQVMMRSSWTDPTAMLVGLKCGPFMGKAQSAEAQFDWGTNHSHPDEGSFQIFSHGQYLAVDPLYTHFKLTANHNTMLFKGQGQLGERLVWNVVEEQVRFKHYPEIIKAGSTPASDYVVADVARAYHPALGVGKYLRHYLFIKPDILAVADEITLDDSGVLYQYPCGEFTVTGGFEHGYEGYAVGTGGEASVVFKGAPGTYRLSVIFLDNYPGEGRYSFTVDDSTVFKWTATKEKTDNYCIVSPEVELKTGSRVAVCCAQREHGYRVIKMTVFSRHAPAVRRVAQWLVHFDPQAKVERRGSLVTSTLAPAALDLYSLAPAGSSMKVEDFRVKKASMEPFRSRGTKRLVISPPFSDSSTTILTLMHTRAAQGPVLENVKATAFDSSRRTRLSWLKDGKPVSVVWDLGKMEYRFE